MLIKNSILPELFLLYRIFYFNQKLLREFMHDNNCSNERIIRELLKIRAIEINGTKRLLNPINKTQRDI